MALIGKFAYSDLCLFYGNKNSQAAGKGIGSSKQNAKNQLEHSGGGFIKNYRFSKGAAHAA